MKHIVFSIAFVSLVAAHQAHAECNTNLTLTCQGAFQSAGKTVVTGVASDRLADEHWDEPSLANCAATVYLTTVHNTSVSIYAQLQGSQVTYDAFASQLYRNDQNEINAYYSNYINANQTVGGVANLGVIHLANPVSYGTQMIMIDDVAVTCSVK